MSKEVDVTGLLNKIVSESPELQELFYDIQPNKLKFPKGKHPHFREQDFYWSITRNANNKYISCLYDWRWNPIQKRYTASPSMVCEHVRKKDAKARAYRMYQQRMDQIRASSTLTNLRDMK